MTDNEFRTHLSKTIYQSLVPSGKNLVRHDVFEAQRAVFLSKCGILIILSLPHRRFSLLYFPHFYPLS
jgi:hypothetical protein